VQVDVLHCLPRIRTVIKNRAVTLRQPLIGSDLLRYQEQVPDEGYIFLGQIVKRGNGFAGTIRTCVGAWGLMSRKATQRSSS
jgi:hypothetical protein